MIPLLENKIEEESSRRPNTSGILTVDEVEPKPRGKALKQDTLKSQAWVSITGNNGGYKSLERRSLSRPLSISLCDQLGCSNDKL